MADSEDWRRQRAAELGVDDLGRTIPRPPPIVRTPVSTPPDPVPEVPADDSVREHADVAPMRCPPPPPEIPAATIEDVRPIPAVWRPPVLPPADAGPRATSRPPWQYAGAAGLVVAAGYAWLAFADRRSAIPVPVAAASRDGSAPSLTAAVDPRPAVVPPRCAGAATIAGLRAAISEGARRQGVPAWRAAGGALIAVTEDRTAVASGHGGVAVCSGTLRFGPLVGGPFSADLDYVVETGPGSSLRVVPLDRLDPIVRSLFGEPAVAQAAARPATVVAAASRPVSAVSARKAPAAPSRIELAAVARPALAAVPRPVLVAVPRAEPAADRAATPAVEPRSVARATALPASVPSRESPTEEIKIVSAPRSCLRPVSRAERLICNSPSLLTLDARLGNSIEALDRPGNSRRLARSREQFAGRFARCTRQACMTEAYRDWIGDLAKVGRDEPEQAVAGRDAP